MEILKDREQFVHRIEEALCSASAIHTANEQTLERSNLRLQYRQSLSAVVNSYTNHRLTLEIIPVRSLRKSTMINNSLYEHDILTAYSLGKIHYKMYRLNESLIFLVIFPTPLPIIYRFYKPFVLPRLGERGDWKTTMFFIDARLLVYQNKNYIIRTSCWTKESGIFIPETDLINKRSFSGNIMDVVSSVNGHHSETTLYGVWIVCERTTYLLYK